MMTEPFVCDECGCTGRPSRVGTICTRCETEYQMGIADADRYRDNRAMFGDDVADQMEIADDIRRGGE